MRAYARIRRALEQAAGRINGRFGESDWTPIRYLNRNYPQSLLMGFFRAAKIALVTPLRDGMTKIRALVEPKIDAAHAGRITQAQYKQIASGVEAQVASIVASRLAPARSRTAGETPWAE